MPRNSSGVYSLPQAAYVAGTTITAAAMNSNLSDIGTALTGSLPVDGSAPMSGPVELATGALAALSLRFDAYPTTGWYSSGANQTTYVSAGSAAIQYNSGGTVTYLQAQTFSGAVTFNAAVNVGTSVPPFGNCYLSVNAGTIYLLPYNGNLLTINGASYVIPSAGVTLSSSGAAISTWYYIYAYMSGSTMTLEYSATTYTTNTTTGVVEKSGDASRTLVGAVYTSGTGTFVDTSGQRQLISWFNRKAKQGWTEFSVNRAGGGGGSLVFSEVNSEIRNFFISWPDEIVKVSHYVAVTHNNAEGNVYSGIAYDAGLTMVAAGHVQYPSGLAGSAISSIGFDYQITGLSVGSIAHYITAVAAVDTGTATWLAGTAAVGGSRIGIEIMG